MNNEFQRPKRASSISTAPSGNPHKHWLSSLDFAGICLKILITAVFRKFFGMFTLCSYLGSIPGFILFAFVSAIIIHPPAHL